MTIRYLLLCPDEKDRQALLAAIFGTFELAPRGKGEIVRLKEEKGGEMEIVGAGAPSRLFAIASKLIDSTVQIHGILMLLSSGDEGSWEETRNLTQWLEDENKPVPLKTWVMGDPGEIDKETSRKILVELMDEHERILKSG